MEKARPSTVNSLLSRDETLMEAHNQECSSQSLVFDIQPDRYFCITIHSKKEFLDDIPHFRSQLKASLKRWSSVNIKAVWVHIALQHSPLIEPCAQHGFTYHHAKEKYVLMKKWLRESAQYNLPSYANHYVGCGGLVVNRQNELLVIKESTGPTNLWKLPGGQADLGEELSTAAMREVLEETGIHTEFRYVVGFRHLHGYSYGLSDFYFVCALTALTTDIIVDEEEVLECRWMKISEFISSTEVSVMNRYLVQRYVDIENDDSENKLRATHIPMYNGKTNLVYAVHGPEEERVVGEGSSSQV